MRWCSVFIFSKTAVTTKLTETEIDLLYFKRRGGYYKLICTIFFIRNFSYGSCFSQMRYGPKTSSGVPIKKNVFKTN